MAKISVYNPKPTPVVYGNGRTLGGLEWLEVEESEVALLIHEKRLRVVPQKNEELPIEDSTAEETEVSFSAASENTVVEESEQDSQSDGESSPEETATIKKSRRKRAETERE